MADLTLASKSIDPSAFNSNLNSDLDNYRHSPVVFASKFKLNLNLAVSNFSFGKNGKLKRIP